MLNARVLGSLLLLFVTTPTFAADGTTGMKIPDAVKQQKFEEDKRITDIELKAQAGSLSRYSLKMDMSYSGPAVNQLHESDMPNPDGRPRPNRTSLSGYAGLRYRLSPNSAVNASTGFRWYTPFQHIKGEETNKPATEKDYEVTNPGLSYDRTYPFLATQMRSSFKSSYVTSDYYLARGQVGSVGYGQGIKYQPGGGRTILGFIADVDYYFFNREYQPRWPGQRTGDGRISQYYWNFIPSLEYKLTDRFNLRTSVAWSYSNLRSEGSFWKWAEVEPTGRAGFGWAITREIYFNPYLGFYTKNPAIKTTNVAFSTVFSIF